MNKIILAAVAALALLPIAAQAGEVENRVHDQQGRINNGVNNGSLTYGQQHRLDNRLGSIQAQRNRDLRRNDGHLTAAQYHNLNRRENNLSNRIYWDKHT